MAGKRWTPREDKLLRSLYPQYIRGAVSKEELCGVFRRKWGSVNCHAGSLGLTGKLYDDIDMDLWNEIKKRGKQ